MLGDAQDGLQVPSATSWGGCLQVLIYVSPGGRWLVVALLGGSCGSESVLKL